MSLIDLLEAFFTEYGYVAVFTVLVACGFGIPIPEDVTLVVGKSAPIAARVAPRFGCLFIGRKAQPCRLITPKR